MNLEEQLRHVPDMPGVYIYRNEEDVIIYVGKAKSLRKRVFSYFGNDSRHNAKTRLLVRQIKRVDVIVVQSEEDALLLENSLIKANQPRYNILLKDDKTYPWVCVTNEEFPRIIVTRRYDKRKGQYYGPYTQVDQLKRVLEELRQLLGYRTCKLALTTQRVNRGEFSACLEYYIHRCQAPCIGKVGTEAYRQTLQTVIYLLKGHVVQATQRLQEQMEKHVENLQFEEAERIQATIEGLKRYREKHTIVNPSLGNLDAMILYLENEKGIIVYMQIREGQIIQSVNREVKNPLHEDESTVWMQGVNMLLSEFETDAPLLLTNIPTTYHPPQYKRIEVPQIGDKSKLIKMGLLNAKRHLVTITTRIEKSPNTLLKQLQQDLGLATLPIRIECIDNSNTLGTYPVSSCVIYINAKPRRSEYRIYNIKTVEGSNDYDTMREIIQRRYGKNEPHPLPDLLIIDGGKGQLNIVLQTLHAIGKDHQCHVVALAEKMEEVYIPGETYPLFLPKTSPTLRLLREIRDEAHNHGVKAHAKRRDSAVKKSDLEQIAGIGPKTVRTLYAHYDSIQSIEQGGPQALTALIGQAKASRVMAWIESKRMNTIDPKKNDQK